jgi:hypothetical protein
MIFWISSNFFIISDVQTDASKPVAQQEIELHADFLVTKVGNESI